MDRAAVLGEILTQTDDIDHQDAMMQRYKPEVDCLHCWPEHPIGFKSKKIAVFKLFRWTDPFHDCHSRQEEAEIRCCKDGLISQNSSANGDVVVLKIDSVLQELIPLSGSGSKHSFTGQLESASQDPRANSPPP